MIEKIHWGVISTAKIGRRTVIPAIQSSRNGVVLAIASRDADRARAVADELGIERAYGSYEALLADPDIDAIYNPLPNDGHAPWSIAAAHAGKPTLCEKPLAVDAPTSQQMVDAFRAADILLAEAFMYRYHPQHQKARELLAQGAVGELRLINIVHTFNMDPADTGNVRLKPEMGGGSLLDVGCYCVNLCRMMVGAEPVAVTAQALYGPTGIDEMFVATLRFPGGILVHFDCGFRAAFRNSYTLVGPEGQITVERAFRPVDDGEAFLRVQRGDGTPETITIPAINQYRLMVEDFGDAVRQGRKVTYDPTDSVLNMRALDALAKAARDGVMVAL